MTLQQMRGLADIARELGDGDIRLTVWQNLLISGVHETRIAQVEEHACGDRADRQGHQRARRPRRLHRQHRLQVRLSNTKDTAMAIAEWVRASARARHSDQYSSDRLPELLRAALHRRHRPASPARVPVPGSEDTVEGFHILVGGGFGADAGIARELYRDVASEDCPAAHRAHPAGLS